MTRNYLASVALMQLLMVSPRGAAFAQDPNLQMRLNQTAPSPQLPMPDLSVGHMQSKKHRPDVKPDRVMVRQQKQHPMR